jgi:hypothetical protein
MPSNARSSKTLSYEDDLGAEIPNGYTEEDMQKALQACSMDNPAAISIAEAARLYKVSPQTLGHRRRGGKPRNQAHENQQLLNKIQEDVLVLYCQNRGWRHEPVDIGELRQLAQQLCGENPGKKWHNGFFKRHPEIKRCWAKAGESKRANGLNRANTKSHFDLLKEARQGVSPENIWNCDEKGIVEGGGMIRRRVIVGTDQRDPKVTADESRKMVTILECVNAIGYAIGPLVIHKGVEKDLEWIRQNPCKAR